MFAVGVYVVRGLLVDVCGVGEGVVERDEGRDVSEDVDCGVCWREDLSEVGIDYGVGDEGVGEGCEEVKGHAAPDCGGSGFED